MNKNINQNSNIVKNLLFSIKEVFQSSPFFFLMSAAIQLMNIALYYSILYFGRNLLNDLNFSRNSQRPWNESIIHVFLWILLIALCSTGTIFLNYYKNVIFQKQQLYFEEYINIKMAQKCMELDISYFDNPQYYDKIKRAQEGKVRLNFVVYRVIFFIANIASFLTALSITLSLSHFIFPVIILTLTLPALLTRGNYYRQLFEYENSQQSTKRKISYLAGLILGKQSAKEARFYEMEDFLSEKYRNQWNQYVSGVKKIIVKRGAIDSLFTVFPVIGIMFSMYFVVRQIGEGNASLGDFAYLFSVFSSLSGSFLSMVEDLAKMSESEAAIQNYNDFMSTNPHVVYKGLLPIETIETIEFRNVCFTYPETEKMVLNNISFQLDARKKNAIVGINGAGKSTIIKLLLRFYDVDSGNIFINHVDIQEYDITKMRQAFSAVFQDYVIYSLSIRDNISFSDYSDKDNDARIMNALDFAELKDDICSRTSSLETFLSRDFTEDGIELSGGQKQKTAIARCAFKNAQVLIMDEPTASLDPEAEYGIIPKLNKLYENRGLIMISHRLSNMKMMDYILVINDGKVVEEGSHNKLLHDKKQYYNMYTVQAERYRTGG